MSQPVSFDAMTKKKFTKIHEMTVTAPPQKPHNSNTTMAHRGLPRGGSSAAPELSSGLNVFYEYIMDHVRCGAGEVSLIGNTKDLNQHRYIIYYNPTLSSSDAKDVVDKESACIKKNASRFRLL